MKKLIGFLAVILAMSAVVQAEPRAYPVPFVEKQHAAVGITFVELPSSGMIKIVTVAGEEVAKLTIPQNSGSYPNWPVVNSSGKPLATGVYYFFVDSPSQQTTGKLVIIR